MATAYFPGDVYINALNIASTSGNSMDLRSLLMNMNIYENV
jgi:hypothetical protein